MVENGYGYEIRNFMNKTEKQVRFLTISLNVFNAKFDFNLFQTNGFFFPGGINFNSHWDKDSSC